MKFFSQKCLKSVFFLIYCCECEYLHENLFRIFQIVIALFFLAIIALCIAIPVAEPQFGFGRRFGGRRFLGGGFRRFGGIGGFRRRGFFG